MILLNFLIFFKFFHIEYGFIIFFYRIFITGFYRKIAGCCYIMHHEGISRESSQEKE